MFCTNLENLASKRRHRGYLPASAVQPPNPWQGVDRGGDSLTWQARFPSPKKSTSCPLSRGRGHKDSFVSSKAGALEEGKRRVHKTGETSRWNGVGVETQPLKTPWEIKTWGPGGMKPNIRLSLAFELAPNAVTFSFLAALKKRRRGENVDSDIRDRWGLDKLNSFEGFPSAREAEGRSLWGMSGRDVLSFLKCRESRVMKRQLPTQAQAGSCDI